ncbi:MAG TPA: AraC family ligand binding domain-containing protein [Terriglobales bacterium]|jgi:quercetin dioxygenase-like cupin family protein|nr:AraC family ligand binding domain-containing protein [Terriglobales bacterium]
MAVYDLNKMRPDYLTREYRRKVANGDSLTLAKLEAKQGSITRAHRHDHEEVILLLKGSWRFQLPTGVVTLYPNQVLTIPRGVEHSSEVLEDVIAIDVCTPQRKDWINGEDRSLHTEQDESLWAI